MSSFDRHGIQHLSPSSINKFRRQPAAWVWHYLLGNKGEAGPAAWRGSAVEAGLEHYLRGGHRDDAPAIAMERFERDAQGVADEDHTKARNEIPAMLTQAIDMTTPLGRPLATQRKCEAYVPGLEVPVIGYVDFSFEDFDLDLKTTRRCPSSVSGDHAGQFATYWAARKKNQNALYVTEKKGTILPLEFPESHWADIVRAAFVIQNLLKRVETGEEAASLYAPDFSTFDWQGADIDAAKNLWRSIP